MKTRVYKAANGGLIFSKPGTIYQGGFFIQVQNFEFGGALVTDNTVSVDVNGTTITQAFDTDSETTITALAAQIATHAAVRSAANIGDFIIHIETKYPGQTVALENYSVTGGASQVSITVSELSPRELDFTDVTFDSWTSGLDYVDLDDVDLPSSDDSAGLYHERWYFDGTPSLVNLVEDTGWDSQLKPFALIRKEYKTRIRAALDAELADPTPDAVVLAGLQRDLDKIKETDEMGHTANLYESTRRTAATDEFLDEFSLFWYQKDLENLNAGVDRPAYRTKLEAKIAEIEAAIAAR